MAQVAILHNTLDFQGGADAVCLAACEALQLEHDVTLFTISETTPSNLTDRFDISVENVGVKMPRGATMIAGTLSTAAPWIGPQLAFRSVALHRFFQSSAAAFDLAVSTANEFSLSLPSVQYIHYPQFRLNRLSDDASGRLNQLWSRLAGPDHTDLTDHDTTLLSNSSWTGAVVEEIYGIRPTVLYPPIDLISCDRAWSNRENGIVVVGRLAPDKRVLDAIRVVDRIREQGHDLHLHIVGATPRAYRSYVTRVTAAANERPHVSLERDVSRDQLEHLLCTHKYGLNMKDREHFGMSVAEYCAAGMVAFAPASGGQQEILDNRSNRLFDSLDEAVSLVIRAAEIDEPPTHSPNRFATERFQTSLREHVNRLVN